MAWRRKCSLPIPALFWEHEGDKAVRIGPWKLVRKYPGDWELYNMERDRTELKDLAAGEPPRVREMAGLHAEWEQRCGVVPWERLETLLSPAYQWWLTGK